MDWFNGNKYRKHTWNHPYFIGQDDGFRFRFSLTPLILSLTILTSIAKHVMIIAYQLIIINTYNLLIMTIYNDYNDSNDYYCLIN